jgi:hypothetical protein
MPGAVPQAGTTARPLYNLGIKSLESDQHAAEVEHHDIAVRFLHSAHPTPGLVRQDNNPRFAVAIPRRAELSSARQRSMAARESMSVRLGINSQREELVGLASRHTVPGDL